MKINNNTRLGELIEKIKKLKEEKNAIILAHNYQRGEIQDIADFVGDSLGLSKQAAKLSCEVIVFCGVDFMAETAKILSPGKTVLIPRREATCPMAAMITGEKLRQLKAQYPEAKVVSYVNTTAEVKAESDVCCTSSNALSVIQNINAEKVIFTPDRNLASYVSRFLAGKQIIPYDGYCYVHERFRVGDIKEAREIYPDAVIFVHPECRPEIVDLADKVASTGGMLKLAKNSGSKRIVIGTEEGLIHRLRKDNPGKEFFTAGPARICMGMKSIRLEDVYLALKEEKYKVEIEDDVCQRAEKSLTEMLKYT